MPKSRTNIGSGGVEAVIGDPFDCLLAYAPVGCGLDADPKPPAMVAKPMAEEWYSIVGCHDLPAPDRQWAGGEGVQRPLQGCIARFRVSPVPSENADVIHVRDQPDPVRQALEHGRQQELADRGRCG